MKNAKILCTLGPSTDGKIRSLVRAGMDGARLNLSHGTFKENLRRIKEIRKVSDDIFIVVDTIGPKIRLGDFKERKVKPGEEVVITAAPVKSRKSNEIPVAFKKLPQYVKTKDKLLIEDGLVGLTVLKSSKDKIYCKVDYGKKLSSRKGVNVPNVKIPFPYTSLQDRKNIEFAIKAKVDFIADSFVRSKRDVQELRKRLKGTNIRIISKIENFEGVQNFDEILNESDGIMIARGDLGVELPTEHIPIFQKEMIKKCNQVGKPVITATQMLDSMIQNRRPTRAEANDVFNAVVDGTDCVMLSGETSIGQYPTEAIKTMRKIVNHAWPFSTQYDSIPSSDYNATVISDAVAYAARANKVNAIVIPTINGFMVQMINRFKIKKPVYAIAKTALLKRQMNIYSGVEAFSPAGKTKNIIDVSIPILRKKKRLKKGDDIILTSGQLKGTELKTNAMQIIQL